MSRANLTLWCDTGRKRYDSARGWADINPSSGEISYRERSGPLVIVTVNPATASWLLAQLRGLA